MAMMCIADGQSSVLETVFENRFMHVDELLRMGANIKTSGGRAALIEGVDSFMAARYGRRTCGWGGHGPCGTCG